MKCDELKPLLYSIRDLAYVDEPQPEPHFQNPHDHAVYKATEVDAAIDELKTEHHKERDEYISMVHQKDKEIAELKAENERLKRALWIARAELCRRLDVDRYLRKHINSWYNENCLTWTEACDSMEVKMCKAESNCRAKAEKFK